MTTSKTTLSFPPHKPVKSPTYFMGTRVRSNDERHMTASAEAAIEAVAGFNLDGYIDQFYRQKEELRRSKSVDAARAKVSVADPVLDRKVGKIEKRLAIKRFGKMSMRSNKALQDIALKQAAAMSSLLELDAWLKQVITGPGSPSVDIEPMMAAMLGVFHVKFAVFAAESADLPSNLVEVIAHQVVMRRFGTPPTMSNPNKDIASAMVGRLDANNRAIGMMARQIGDLDSRIGALRSTQ